MDDATGWIIIGGVSIGLVLAIVAVVVSLWRARGPQSADPKMAPAMKASWAQAEATRAKAALAGIPLNFDPATLTEPRKLRMAAMTIVSVVLLAVIWYVARQQIGVLLYKAVLLTGAAVIAYYVDRTAFPDSRPHMIADEKLRSRAELRRAIIIAAGMLTAGLGA